MGVDQGVGVLLIGGPALLVGQRLQALSEGLGNVGINRIDKAAVKLFVAFERRGLDVAVVDLTVGVPAEEGGIQPAVFIGKDDVVGEVLSCR